MKVILKIIAPLIFLLTWQLFSFAGFWNSEILPPPAKVLAIIPQLFVDSSLLIDILDSLKRVFVGLCLASVIGTIVGLSFGVSKTAKSLFSSLLELLRPIPPIAWISLAVLWFGIGDKPAYFLVFLGSFFPIFTNVYFGITSVETIHKNAAFSLGAKKRHYILHILLPSAMPSIFTGLKAGLGISWMMVIVAELVGAQSGLGYMIQNSRLLLQTEKVLIGMMIIGAIGFLMNWAMTKIEGSLMPWRLT